MSRFEWMQKHGLDGAELGIVRPDILAKFFRYSMFLNLLGDGKKKEDAISLTAEQTKVDETTIYRAIQFFAS